MPGSYETFLSVNKKNLILQVNSDWLFYLNYFNLCPATSIYLNNIDLLMNPEEEREKICKYFRKMSLPVKKCLFPSIGFGWTINGRTERSFRPWLLTTHYLKLFRK